MSDAPKKRDSVPGFFLDPKVIRENFPGSEFPAEEDISGTIHEAQTGPREAPTLVPCEACRDCKVCGGIHMTTAERNAWWRSLSRGTDK